MEKAKYQPDEIDRMIDEEISRIDAANSAAFPTLSPRPTSLLDRLLNFLRAPMKRCKSKK